MKIYTRKGCPRCEILKNLAIKNNIDFETEEDLTNIINLGFTSVPILENHDIYYTYVEAVKFVSNFRKGENTL